MKAIARSELHTRGLADLLLRRMLLHDVRRKIQAQKLLQLI